MPEIDGLEATQQIRLSLSNLKSRQPRIVGLTANSFSEERERCLEAGMDDKLTKPVRIGELKSMLEATSRIGTIDGLNPTEDPTLPVCDERQFNELLEVQGSDGLVAGVLQLFIDQAEEFANLLPELENDPIALGLEAHKMKSAAGYVGATQAAYYCGIAENAARLSQPELRQAVVADLKKSLNISIVEYRKRLKAHPVSI